MTAASNSSTFRPSTYTKGGCNGPEPGTDLSDTAVDTPAGVTTTLGDLVGRVTVLETGSITCPLDRRHRPETPHLGGPGHR